MFEVAAELTGDERAACLQERCAGDESLRSEVESLLASDAQADGFIENPATSIPREVPEGMAEEPFGARQFGAYRTIREIGRGGLGTVYLAARSDAAYKKEVAIKLLRRGLDTDDILRRFRNERQILARLEHPNIARLIDGGMTEDGLPYFVMEYVEGEPLNAYCETRNLTTNERLKFFRTVCSAVTYAHQHLVTHRDRKPSNILVTGEGEVKLLDFGIAKLLGADEEAAFRTMTEQRVMTPDYASPEQVRGEAITTASDVYSLGVVLYELLTGTKPYRLTNRSAKELENAITEQTPERPSTAVTSNQQSAIRNQKFLKGDLDNIVLKALRKEPARRYASVEQFSEDIRRHLAGLPVGAHKDTVGYRASKFIRRHKVGVLAALLVGATLVAGIFATGWEARRANEQRLRAERRFEDVRQLAHSLMFEIHDSVRDLQGSTATRRLIVTRALQYLDGLAQEAGDNPSLQRELATAYEKVGDVQGNPYSANLGDTEGALTSYRKAARIRETLRQTGASTETEMELGRTCRALGDILEVKGDLAKTLGEYRRSLQIFEQVAADDPNSPEVKDELARAYETMADGYGHAARAEAIRLTNYQKSLAIREMLLGKEPSSTKLQRSVALSLLKVGAVSDPHRPEATAAVRRAVAMLEALSAADPNDGRARRAVGFAYYQLGNTLFEAGDFPGALASRQKAFAIREQFAANDPQNAQARFDLAVAYTDLAEALTATGQPGPAVEHARKGLAVFAELTAADPSNAIYSRNVALCEEKLGDAWARSGAASDAPETERVRAWSEARDWYEKSAKIFASLRAHGILTPTDAEKPQELSHRRAACDRAIGLLTATH